MSPAQIKDVYDEPKLTERDPIFDDVYSEQEDDEEAEEDNTVTPPVLVYTPIFCSPLILVYSYFWYSSLVYGVYYKPI